MKPLSDHRVAKVRLNTHRPNLKADDDCPKNNSVPEAAKYNYDRADKEAVKNAIRNANWRECLETKETDIKTKYNQLVIQCLERAKVPKNHWHNRKCETPREVKDILNKIEKAEVKCGNQNYTYHDYSVANEEIKGLNEKLQELIDSSNVEKEDKLLKDINNNPQAFYKHANKMRKGKTKIGPLLSGKTYISGPLKMAELLSKQYEGV